MTGRILFFVPGLSVGGAERHTVDLRARLARLGYDTGLMVQAHRRSDVIMAHPGAADAALLDTKGMSDARGWTKVRDELKRQAPDLIVAVNQAPLMVAIAARCLGFTRARVLCVFHTTLLRPTERRMFFLFRWALRLSDALVFVSANQKDYWTRQGLTSRMTPVILNGVDFAHFRASPDLRAATRRQLGFVESDYVLGMVAAFRSEKNHMALIEAVAGLRARGLPAKALFVGDGPTQGSARAATQTMGLTEHIVFAGEQADVRPFICASDAGVLCSTAVETFSLSALEFLASGVPMVMSRLGGASEIVADGVNGFLFETGNTGEMIGRLQALADRDTRDRLALKARTSIEALSTDNMVRSYAHLFDRMMSKKRN